MAFTAIKKPRIYQSIIEQIKHLIESGDIQPGDKLPSERALAQSLSVSRSAVREAISVLASANLIEVLPGIGIYLKKSPQEQLLAEINALMEDEQVSLLEILELRLGVEGQAAYLAAERRTLVQLDVIQAKYRALELAARTNQVAAKEDYEFHISIVAASQNRLLLQAVKVFSDKFHKGIQQSRTRTMQDPDKVERVLDEHKKIYEAIRDGDAERARLMMISHLNAIKERYAVDFK
ncbi:FadR family transcriptional regulator [Alicyclobacillus cycloheptanicus]|uniref:GntR family transcriptional repressor for pyruvate dehydrogenase complex n=1 Tax=Alicyclobacillus cycloheptanicus TaxID=1457 RepID=A0ABT9XHN9_9BACL|nr:FadR/GntR family transcriptional regulator [Alicyclobacillus cycloheptanicus]MDQ0189808.1 GntR family transcriptional repressor for pyruvate dehydrogenase complex [Alicyclobacillus cycloheptanicus]WDM02501.1 FadR family transcriptional regulator [Alicyclobacillus cycloheptanicus]